MTKPDLMAELAKVVRLSECATAGEWRTEYRKSPRGYGQEVFDSSGATIAELAWHAVPKNETTTTTDREPNAQLIVAAVNFLRTHHAELEAGGRDKQRLDWLETMANKPGGLLLHDGSESGRCGLGLRPGAANRDLRTAIDQAMHNSAREG